MNNRELLEFAAKSAGVSFWEVGDILFIAHGKQWNPLTDDGDALRLSVKLKLDICFYDGFGEVGVQADFGEIVVEANEDYGDDLHAATRRAITRAAAEIGRMME